MPPRCGIVFSAAPCDKDELNSLTIHAMTAALFYYFFIIPVKKILGKTFSE
jgi:hypothetical protein